MRKLHICRLKLKHLCKGSINRYIYLSVLNTEHHVLNCISITGFIQVLGFVIQDYATQHLVHQ